MFVPILAMSSESQVALVIVNLTINCIVALVLAWVGRITVRLNNAERDVHAMVKSLVDQRVGSLEKSLKSLVEELRAQVRDGDAALDRLLRDDNELRIALERKFGEVMRHTMERFVPRPDHQEIVRKLESLTESVIRLNTLLANSAAAGRTQTAGRR